MSTLTHYHKCIRKTTAAFASLFNNILLIREEAGGGEVQRLIVPLEFGDKEKYVKRLQNDPELDKRVQVTLPRMSYELNGFRYDPSRKLNTNYKITSINENTDSVFYQYNPVPYDFDFSLTIYTRNIEDGNQILEQIIPYFAPDYTLKINFIPELNVIKNLPIILNTTQPMIDSDGLFNSETRTVYWTLNFTVKGFIFGAAKDTGDSGIIKNANINFRSITTTSNNLILSPNGYGDYKFNEIVYQGLNLENSYASAIVKQWNSNTRTISVENVRGNFKVNQPLIGKDTLSIHVISSYSNTNINVLSHTYVSPQSANVNSNWIANNEIIEYV